MAALHGAPSLIQSDHALLHCIYVWATPGLQLQDEQILNLARVNPTCVTFEKVSALRRRRSASPVDLDWSGIICWLSIVHVQDEMKGDEFLSMYARQNPNAVAVPADLGTRTSVYTLGPPSPPSIAIPPLPDPKGFVLPTYQGLGATDMDEEDLKKIIQVQHSVLDQATKWKYEWRREAQKVLPFLYLGPSSATKDRDYLRNEGITMLLVIRDVKSAHARLLNGDKVAQEIGLESAAVDVSGNQQLIAVLPAAIKKINNHLLSIFRQNPVRSADQDADKSSSGEGIIKQGKVLVFCESGNERSASVVTAYIMAMYGMDLVTSVQFVQSQRFCIALDDSMKSLLLSFQDILQAQRDIRKAGPLIYGARATLTVHENKSSSYRFGKRKIEDAMDDDEDVEMDLSGEMDKERFEDRGPIQPFSDEQLL